MTIDEMLLEALAAHLKGEKVNWDQPVTPEEWQGLFQLANEHQILPMIFETVYECPAIASAVPKMLMQVRQIMTQSIMFQVRRTAEFQQIFQALCDAGVHPLVVKGLACRHLYPAPDSRSSNDEDVLIPWEEFALANETLQQNGMILLEPDADIEKEFEVPYRNAAGVLVIELHKDLFSGESDAYGEFNEIFADVRECPVEFQENGVTFYSLSHTNHLAYLIAHALKHFLHGGFGIRQVCDIILYAQNYQDDIDWGVVYEKCQRMNAVFFTAALFDIAEKQLQIKLEGKYAQSAWSKIQADGEEMLADLLESGIYGSANLSRKHSSTITLNAVAAEKKGGKAEMNAAKSLFPSAKSLAGRYPYLQKYPFLLPIAWIMRIWGYYKENKQRDGENQAAEALQIGKERIELMRKYKIVK